MNELQELKIVQTLVDEDGREYYAALLGEREVGSVLYNPVPKYRFFAQEGMPAIQELDVHEVYRRRGIGRALIEFCEDLARSRGQRRMGIGVGLTASYGAAQRLYVKMGYVPDGFGVTYDRQIVGHGEIRPIDDEMSLMMVKRLVD